MSDRKDSDIKRAHAFIESVMVYHEPAGLTDEALAAEFAKVREDERERMKGLVCFCLWKSPCDGKGWRSRLEGHPTCRYCIERNLENARCLCAGCDECGRGE